MLATIDFFTVKSMLLLTFLWVKRKSQRDVTLIVKSDEEIFNFPGKTRSSVWRCLWF
jgi:hypothetical protein